MAVKYPHTRILNSSFFKFKIFPVVVSSSNVIVFKNQTKTLTLNWQQVLESYIPSGSVKYLIYFNLINYNGSLVLIPTTITLSL